mgnify:CR=1 FL=1
MSSSNLINDLFDIYCKNFEPYTFTIKLIDKEINLAFPEDRFPHLIGIDKVYTGLKAKTIVENIKTKTYDINVIQKSFAAAYKDMELKVSYFHLIKNIFEGCEAYKIFSLPGKIKGDYIVLKMETGIEINLVIDKNEFLGKHVPRSYLVNARPKYHGKFIKDAAGKDILRIEKVEKATGTFHLIYDKELTENNTIESIRKQLVDLGYIVDSTIISNIIGFNGRANKYHSVAEILELINNRTITEATQKVLLENINNGLIKEKTIKSANK